MTDYPTDERTPDVEPAQYRGPLLPIPDDPVHAAIWMAVHTGDDEAMRAALAMMAARSRAAMYAALAEFRGMVKPILKHDTALNQGRKMYSYASLASVHEHVDPLLAQCGLAVFYSQRLLDGDVCEVRCTVTHSSGSSYHSDFVAQIIPPRGITNVQQAVAAANTFARRYAILGALGLATDEDDESVLMDSSRESAHRGQPQKSHAPMPTSSAPSTRTSNASASPDMPPAPPPDGALFGGPQQQSDAPAKRKIAGVISAAQVKKLYFELKANDKTPDDLKQHMDVEHLQDIPRGRMQDALAFAKGNAS